MIHENYFNDLKEKTWVELSSDALIFSQSKFERVKRQVSMFTLADKLVDKLTEQVSALIDFGSMAYENRENYIDSHHRHDNLYTKTEIRNSFSPSTNQIGNFFRVMDVFVDGKIRHVYAPLSCIQVTYTIPQTFSGIQPGDVKFVYGNTLEPITNSNFNGWVYPDGTSYFVSSYVNGERLRTLFPDSGDTQKFKIPNVDTFIKLNPGILTGSDSMKRETGRVITAEHSHNVDLDASIRVKISVDVPIGPTAGHESDISAATHAMKYPNTLVDSGKDSGISVTAQLECLGSAETDISAIAGESYPNHFMFPMMVYIGQKR